MTSQKTINAQFKSGIFCFQNRAEAPGGAGHDTNHQPDWSCQLTATPCLTSLRNRGIKLFWPLPWRGRTCRFVSDGRRPAAWQEKNHRGQWIEGTTGWRPAFGGRRLLTWRPPWTGSPAAWPCLLAILPAARRTCWPGRPAPGLGPDTASPAPAPCWHCSPLRPPYTHNRNKVVTREYIIKVAISGVFFFTARERSWAPHVTQTTEEDKDEDFEAS